jgi:SpoVK/Ycf46/Vps4 family AAA+-type ATPase
MRYRLLWFADTSPDAQVPLLTRALRVDERIIRYLLGSDECDERLQCCCRRVTPSRSFHELVSDGNGQEDLVRIARWHAARNLPAIMYFFGPYGTGKKHTAEAICQVLSKQMLVFDSRMLKEPQKNDLLLLLLREAMLQKSCIYFEHFDQVLAGDGAVDPLRLFGELDRFTGWIFISATQPYEPPALFQAHAFYRYEFLYPSFEARKELWRRFLTDAVTADVDIPALATAFRFSGGQILDAISSARGIAKAKNPDQTAVSMDDLRRGCKAQSNKNLSVYARMVRSRYQWGDIVLIPDAKAQLQEICDYIRFRGRVFTDWGFGNKLSLGKGLNILFTGPSGTGKTMAAEIIAAQAGLDLYKIDLSSVVSKYIGETEKNLKNIFLEAETSNAILFFDEADALFGKRTEVRDAHDRYANIEVNYLLQKMEDYEGVVILASNFPKNIDEAFRRRMHFSVDFAVPERDLREEIWTHIFPDKTPLGDDIDFTFLSGFKISGGNIKNIALNAAFLAAADSGEVTMKCLIKATRREFQKIGRLYVKEEFGPYYHFIEGDA